MATAERIPPEVPQDRIILTLTEDEAFAVKSVLSYAAVSDAGLPHVTAVRRALEPLVPGASHTYRKKN